MEGGEGVGGSKGRMQAAAKSSKRPRVSEATLAWQLQTPKRALSLFDARASLSRVCLSLTRQAPHLQVMLVALIGPTCSGKSSVAQYLVERHGFRRVYVKGKGCVAHKIEADANHLLAKATLSDTKTVFESFDNFLEYATTNWRENMVTTDFHTSKEIGVGFDKRPFFLLVGVDAPLLTRWARFTDKV